MKSRSIKTLILAVIIVGGIWVLSNRDQIEKPGDVVSLIKQKLTAAQAGFSKYTAPEESPAVTPGDWTSQPGSNQSNPVAQRQPAVSNVIRIASFRLNPIVTQQSLGRDLDLIADICRRYDAIAIQEIDSRGNTWLTQLTDRMNVMGAAGTTRLPSGQVQSNYMFVSDRTHNLNQPTQSAIIYNRQTLVLDQSQWYTVKDPGRVLSRQPMVAWFRTRGPSPDQAFTFSLVNVKFGAKENELVHLGELFRAIRDDGRHEDDVLIVGDFNGADEQLHPLQKRLGLTWVMSSRSQATGIDSQFGNLVFNEMATVEFSGRSGVFDFLRRFNLRVADAKRISDHMPVWAEFNVFEGARSPHPSGNSIQLPGRVAEKENSVQH